MKELIYLPMAIFKVLLIWGKMLRIIAYDKVKGAV